jgi:proline dehydrogenase
MRALLLYLSRQESFKNFLMRFKIFRATAWRFVAGESIEDAVRVARDLNRRGIRVTMDLLGENTHSQEDALRSTTEILAMLGRIHEEKIDGNVSLKLSQLGMGLEDDLCYRNLREIVQHAAGFGNYVRVDMEDSPFTQRTLDIVLRVHAEFPCVGTVIQSYLHRSGNDVRMLIEKGVGIRLCKGAYSEPGTIAFKKKSETDANYVELMKLMLPSGLPHGIATHDETMISSTRKFADEQNIPRERVEFQMLYGIRRDLQQYLVQEGYRMRVYLPYGTRWYPYFMRRLAERPANLLFILRNLIRK